MRACVRETGNRGRERACGVRRRKAAYLKDGDTKLGRRVGHDDASGVQGLDLVLGTTLSASDDGASVACVQKMKRLRLSSRTRGSAKGRGAQGRRDKGKTRRHGQGRGDKRKDEETGWRAHQGPLPSRAKIAQAHLPPYPTQPNPPTQHALPATPATPATPALPATPAQPATYPCGVQAARSGRR